MAKRRQAGRRAGRPGDAPDLDAPDTPPDDAASDDTPAGDGEAGRLDAAAAARAAASGRAAQRLAAGRQAAGYTAPAAPEVVAPGQDTTTVRPGAEPWSAFPDAPPRPRRAARPPSTPSTPPSRPSAPPATPSTPSASPAHRDIRHVPAADTPPGPAPRRQLPIVIPSVAELAVYGSLATAVAVAVMIVNGRPYWQAAAVVAAAAAVIVLVSFVAVRSRPERTDDDTGDPTRPGSTGRRRRRR